MTKIRTKLYIFLFFFFTSIFFPFFFIFFFVGGTMAHPDPPLPPSLRPRLTECLELLYEVTLRSNEMMYLFELKFERDMHHLTFECSIA
jgi:hypothetical protein